MSRTKTFEVDGNERITVDEIDAEQDFVVLTRTERVRHSPTGKFRFVESIAIPRVAWRAILRWSGE